MFGVISGAAIGDSVEGSNGVQVQNLRTTQNSYENRPVAYNVVYEFGGKQYSVQMPNDPGPTVQLQVTPVAASVPPVRHTTVVTYGSRFINSPLTSWPSRQSISHAYPGYSYGYYSQPSYFPVVAAMGLGLGMAAH